MHTNSVFVWKWTHSKEKTMNAVQPFCLFPNLFFKSFSLSSSWSSLGSLQWRNIWTRRQSLSPLRRNCRKKVGCRLPWDHWSKQDCAICTNEQEFGQCEQIYEDLFNAESEQIVEATGCLQPCTYNEYKFVSENPKRLAATDDPKPRDGSQTVLSFWVASSKTWIEEEVLLYPFTSFLAEFGGALGLFLGFSFMTIWHQIRGCCCK